MTPAALPDDETERLGALKALGLLDTAADPELDALVEAAAVLLDAPISLISLIDADRQWFKANRGLEGVSETPREQAFCAHAILGGDVLEVPDARADPRFADNPLVTGAPNIRFYAGAPLVLRGGARIGTLCVIGREPRRLTDAERRALVALGRAAVRLIESRQADRHELRRLALDDAHQRMALALDTGNIGLWDVVLGAREAHWDRWVFQQYGRPSAAGTVDYGTWLSWVHPDDRVPLQREIAEAARGIPKRGVEFRAVWPDGSVRHLRAIARAIPGTEGRPARLIGLNWDVTEERQLQQALARESELLRVTLASIGEAVVTADAQGRLTWLNPAAERLTRWRSDDVAGRPLSEVLAIVDEDDAAARIDPVAAAIEDRRVVEAGHHAVLVDREGGRHGVECTASPIRDPQGAVLGAVVVLRDVTEQRRLSREMRHRAMHDALTQLFNREELELRLARAHDEACAEGTQHALMVIDLDQFKLVNDACGHAAGDQLLRQVARLLADGVRAHDVLARLGGDEFAVLLEHCPPAQAQRVAQQLCERLDAYRFDQDGHRFRIGASIGIAPVDATLPTVAAVLQAADAACYAAKEAGRNRVHLWADSDRAIRARHGEMRWATRLEAALDEGRFVLFRQHVSALGAAPAGVHFEVLLRLRDEDGRLMAPGLFLPAAERFHLATRIDRWVLREVLGRMPALLAAATGPVLVGVNLSGQSVGDRAFHELVLGQLAAAGPAVCAALCIEITETAAITNMVDASAFVEGLRALGVRVALDDFGAGASSFGYLKSLRVDFLKIDGQFIRRLPEDALDQAAVRGFVEVARVVGLQTIAEFVDREAVLDQLRAMGVDHAQGYLLHEPEPWTP